MIGACFLKRQPEAVDRHWKLAFRSFYDSFAIEKKWGVCAFLVWGWIIIVEQSTFGLCYDDDKQLTAINRMLWMAWFIILMWNIRWIVDLKLFAFHFCLKAFASSPLVLLHKWNILRRTDKFSGFCLYEKQKWSHSNVWHQKDQGQCDKLIRPGHLCSEKMSLKILIIVNKVCIVSLVYFEDIFSLQTLFQQQHFTIKTISNAHVVPAFTVRI